MIMFSCIVSIILLILCIFKRNSKFTFYLLFTWMWILFAFNHANADFRMYRSIYNGTLSVSSMEYGFVLLCKVFRNLGFSYNMFLALYSFVGLTLIRKTIFKYSKNISLTLALYFIFPFVFDVIQIRNFMAFAIVIYSLKYLLDEKNLKKYIILVLIASMFHSFAIIALSFMFLNKFKSSKSIFISFLIITGIVIILRNGLLVDILSKILNSEKVAAYFIDSRYMPGFKTSLFSIAICLLMCIISYFIYSKNKDDFSRLTYQIFIFILILIPLLFYNATIMRFPRMMLILLYIGFSNNIKVRTKQNRYMYNKRNMFVSLLFAILITLWVDTFILSINNQKSTVYPVLRDNYFVEIFKKEE